MSTKTSTAALASFRLGHLPHQRRAPSHSEDFVGTAFLSGPLHLEGATPFVIRTEAIMLTNTRWQLRSYPAVLNLILRITCGLLLWTLGASAMDIRLSHVQPKEHRITITFPADRSNIVELQRWVNAGHDPWCLDPQMVAAAALRRVSSQFSDYELASLSFEIEQLENTKAVYTFHSLNGDTTYRVTLRRHLYLLRSAGSLNRIVWVPESAEVITRDTRD